MTLELAGAVDVDPPLTAPEIAYVRRLADDPDARLMAWSPARDGTSLRPRSIADVAACVESMTYLLATMERPGRLRGKVAAYDVATRRLVVLTVSRGRVTERLLHSPTRGAAPRPRSNVIDLASRRRATARDVIA